MIEFLAGRNVALGALPFGGRPSSPRSARAEGACGYPGAAPRGGAEVAQAVVGVPACSMKSFQIFAGSGRRPRPSSDCNLVTDPDADNQRVVEPDEPGIAIVLACSVAGRKAPQRRRPAGAAFNHALQKADQLGLIFREAVPQLPEGATGT